MVLDTSDYVAMPVRLRSIPVQIEDPLGRPAHVALKPRNPNEVIARCSTHLRKQGSSLVPPISAGAERDSIPDVASQPPGESGILDPPD